MNDKATELNGGRITIRPWRLTDASALYALASDPEVAERTGFPVHKSIEDSLRVIQEVFSAPECFAITLKETGEVVGCIQVFVPGDAARSESVYESDLVEVGFWLGRRYWGRGLMSESLSLLYSEQYHSGRFRWRVMDGRTKKDNCAARKVFEKCGFEDWTGSMDEDAHYRKYGIVPDSDCLHGLVGEIGNQYFKIVSGLSYMDAKAAGVAERAAVEGTRVACRLVDGVCESCVVACDAPPFLLEGHGVGAIIRGYLYVEPVKCEKLEREESTHLMSPDSSDADIVLRIATRDGRVYGTIDAFPHLITLLHPDSRDADLETISALHNLRDGDLVRLYGRIVLEELEGHGNMERSDEC